MGAAVSMTRRVPEYQKEVRQMNQNKRDKDNKNNEPMEYAEIRSLLVFQIMQVFSAPLIALTVYYLVLPDGFTSSIVIAFSSGFASETILVLLRNFLERISNIFDVDSSRQERKSNP